MARKIGIIGLGHVGVTLLHELISSEVCQDFVLIDKDETKLQADALDFQDRAAQTAYPIRFYLNDYQSLVDADVVVSCLGNIGLQANQQKSRFAELPINSQEVEEVSAKLKASGFSGLLLVVTNPVDVITALYQHHTGFAKERVIGTGTSLDTARLKRVLSDYLEVPAQEVQTYVLGEHGNSQFPAWSQTRVGGRLVADELSEETLVNLAQEARMGGHDVFFGKGYTNFAIATAARRLLEAVLDDSHAVLPVSHFVEAYKGYISCPARIGATGILETVALGLTPTEEQALVHSAGIIATNQELALKGEWDDLALT